ncbi:MAG TPA: cytochrome c biogenesis protein ResB, partial [Sulfuricaulis sp.]|nr:cytochrome c biogenesis protein ResB [Sulfuricaulis sp.]
MLQSAVMRRALHLLASLRLTFAGMLLLVVAVLATFRGGLTLTWVAVVLTLLGLNLLAALATHARLRQSFGLLVFHLSLLVILLGAAAGLLLRFEGRLEIVEGQMLGPEQVEVVTRGPWHRLHLHEAAFLQGPVEVDYAPGNVRRATRSVVWIPGRDYQGQSRSLGENQALHKAEYRFVTTSNKGFAVLFTWQGDDGRVESGAVHFPSYPLYDWKQKKEWRTPMGQSLQLVLKPAVEISPDRNWTLSAALGGDLVVHDEGGESLLAPGAVREYEGG